MIRICIRCKQPITFDWLELPVVYSRRTMRVVARFYSHFDTAACDAEIARAHRIVAGEIPSPRDIGVQRAQLLHTLIAEVPLKQTPVGVS